MSAKTSFGFEDLLVEELGKVGAINLKKGTRIVHFEGDLETMYRANLYSRLALRILKPIKSFPAGNEQQLYDEIKKIDWSEYLTENDTLAVDAVTSYSTLTHTLYISLKTKDAIVDQFREKTGVRPNVDLRFPKVRINIHIHQNIASVSLDSSGDSLHKRGYRSQQGEAPLNETLAAGMIMLSKWDRASNFTDIMCGSGTIVIEAAMMARNIAPGIFRNEFGFERWNDYDAELWKSLLDEAKQNEKPSLDFSITGIDRSHQAIRNSTENAKEAGVENDIDFHAMPFEDYTPKDSVQTIVTNPPYGGRITDDDLFNLYKNIGDQLKLKYSGSNAWILTANKEAAKNIGLHATAKIQLYNGALECRMLKYELYRGTKKIHKIKDGNNEEV
ncbi:MAG: methyltransferase [Bacteroidia bacterium]|nr:methyltransferase [Bacteroidota bacterium]MBK7429847.1 methyltransferase [Bacteroidota bacterium]MBP9790225.1 methyltransferase [Bacteroidia bacterium]MBP9922244.1 methyltransferase [Bacteroidia bacterium]